MNLHLFLNPIVSQPVAALTPQIDNKIAISTFLALGFYCAMNKLSSIELNPTDKFALSWGMPIAVLVNQVWRQTMVSQLPATRNNLFFKVAVSPWMFLTTYALSKISNNFFYEWPTAIATAAVVGLNSLDKSTAAINRHDYLSLPIHLFNAVGTGLLTLDILRIRPLLDRVSWAKMSNVTSDSDSDFDQKELQKKLEEIKKKGEKKLADINKETEESVARLEESAKKSTIRLEEKADKAIEKADKAIKKIEEGLKHDREENERRLKENQRELEEMNAESSRRIREEGKREWQRMFAGFDQPENVAPQNCKPVDPNTFKGLPILDHVTHNDLNPLCPDDAKIILAPKGFDEPSYIDKGCQYVANLRKQMMLLVHPDKQANKNVAAHAFQAVQTAAETLCPKV